jgi:hypothetical protein
VNPGPATAPLLLWNLTLHCQKHPKKLRIHGFSQMLIEAGLHGAAFVLCLTPPRERNEEHRGALAALQMLASVSHTMTGWPMGRPIRRIKPTTVTKAATAHPHRPM